MRAALAAALLLLPAVAAAPLPAAPEVQAVWQAAVVSGRPEAEWPDVRLRPLAGVHEFGLAVQNGLSGPVRNLTLVVGAPGQPFHLSLEGPDPADVRPNATKPYAFWRELPRPEDAGSGCARCGYVILHSNHSDDFSGGFEFEARMFFERPDGTLATSSSLLRGTVEGGPFRFEPWMVWLVGVTLLVVLAAALWMSRRHPPPRV